MAGTGRQRGQRGTAHREPRFEAIYVFNHTARRHLVCTQDSQPPHNLAPPSAPSALNNGLKDVL